MKERVDVLLINPNDRKWIHLALGDEFSAFELTVLAGLFVTYA
jgi:hypothetical protein